MMHRRGSNHRFANRWPGRMTLHHLTRHATYYDNIDDSDHVIVSKEHKTVCLEHWKGSR